MRKTLSCQFGLGCPSLLMRLLPAVVLLLPVRALADEWKLECVHLKNDNTILCIIDEVTDTEVHIRAIKLPGGRPAVIFPPTTLKTSEVASLDRLAEEDHKQLEERLKTRASERQNWTSLLQAIDPAHKTDKRSEKLEFSQVPFGGGKGLGYQSTHFRIASNAREDLVYLTAVQLEDSHAAYTRFLPPRVQKAEPTTVLLPQSQADYQALLKNEGLAFLNAAYYDAAHNQIVCPSDLQRLSDRWAAAYEENRKVLDKLDQQEADLNKLYRGQIPTDRKKQLAADRARVQQANDQNRKECEALLRKLFQPLDHEAFHAYLANFVYPPDQADVPRWLNEGLAQIFETAELEAGELRVDRPDRERLTRAQQMLTRGELVLPSALLKSGPKQFLAVHNSDRITSDAHYVSSWALAWYLMFDRKLLGTTALDDYVVALHRGADPQQAFHDLVDQPLPEFEKQFRDYLTRLEPDGKLRQPRKN